MSDKIDKRSKIPTPDDFARAKANMRREYRHMDDVWTDFTEHFKKICPLDYFSIMPQGEREFRAYIFLEKVLDAIECENGPMGGKMKDFIYNELDRYGRGSRKDIVVHFEFDSLENVNRNFEGSYDLRLRA